MDEKFDVLNLDDVVAVAPETFEDLDITRTSKVIHLLEAIQACFGTDTKVAALFSQAGIDCEVLRVGTNGWQQGQIRITVEFCPSPNSSDLPHSTNNNHVHRQVTEN